MGVRNAHRICVRAVHTTFPPKTTDTIHPPINKTTKTTPKNIIHPQKTTKKIHLPIHKLPSSSHSPPTPPTIMRCMCDPIRQPQVSHITTRLHGNHTGDNKGREAQASSTCVLEPHSKVDTTYCTFLGSFHRCTDEGVGGRGELRGWGEGWIGERGGLGRGVFVW